MVGFKLFLKNLSYVLMDDAFSQVVDPHRITHIIESSVPLFSLTDYDDNIHDLLTAKPTSPDVTSPQSSSILIHHDDKFIGNGKQHSV